MKKVKNRVLPWLIAVSVLALAFLPFFINDMVNAGSDDPTKRYYADACVRRLNVALYPEYELTFHAKKKSAVNFGKYSVVFQLNSLTAYGLEYKNGKFFGSAAEMYEGFSLKPSLFTGDAVAADIEDGKTYFIYFALRNGAEFLTSYGGGDIFWVAYSAGNPALETESVWGVPYALYKEYGKDAFFVALTEIYYFLSQENNMAFFDKSGAFGPLEAEIAKLDKAQFEESMTPVGFLARGKGSSLRSLLSDENLKAVKIKRCQ